MCYNSQVPQKSLSHKEVRPTSPTNMSDSRVRDKEHVALASSPPSSGHVDGIVYV